MEQTIRRVQSPYRTGNRKNEANEKVSKYWTKFVMQTIISAVILVTFLYCRSVNAITTSTFWEKTTDILDNDVSMEDMKKGIEWGIECVKVMVPEFLTEEGNIKVSGDNIINSESENNEVKSESLNLANEEITSDINQGEEDIRNILKVMTVLRPVKGEISSKFGERVDPITKNNGVHTGTDYAVAVGTQVKSAISGTVVEVKKNNPSFGNFVRIKNADIVTTYAHCSAIKVKEGEKVKQGDIIALSGNTGKSSGPHLHFEVSKDGRVVNPEKLTG